MSNLSKSTLIYTLGNILPKLIGFIFLPIYSRAMSVEDFGIIASIEVLSSIITIFMCLCLDRAARRLYFSKDICKKELLSTLYYSSVICGLLMLIPLYLLRIPLEMIYSNISYNPYIILCIATTFLNIFSIIPSVYYQLSSNPKMFVLFNLGRTILQTALIIGFVVVYDYGALGVLYALLATSFIFAPVSLFIAINNFGFKFKGSLLKQAIQYSWPFIPTLLIAWILNMSDRLFIDNYIGVESLGIYSMAYKISMVFLVFTNSFSMAFMPRFHELAENGEHSKGELGKNINNIVLIFIFLFFSACFISKDVVDLLLPSSYFDSINIILILLTSHVFSSIMGVSSTLYIIQSKRTKLNLQISSVAAIINVMLNAAFIPKFGITGAAMATLISMLLLNIIQYKKSKTCFFIPLNWFLYISLISLTLLFVSISNKLIQSGGLYLLIVKIIAILVFCLFFIVRYYGLNMVLKWLKLKTLR